MNDERTQFDQWCAKRLEQQLDALSVRFESLLFQKTGERWHVYVKKSCKDFIFGFISRTSLLETVSWTVRRIAEKWDDWIAFAEAETTSIIEKWHIRKKLISDEPDAWEPYLRYVNTLYEIAECGDYDPFSKEVMKAGCKFRQESKQENG